MNILIFMTIKNTPNATAVPIKAPLVLARNRKTASREHNITAGTLNTALNPLPNIPDIMKVKRYTSIHAEKSLGKGKDAVGKVVPPWALSWNLKTG